MSSPDHSHLPAVAASSGEAVTAAAGRTASRVVGWSQDLAGDIDEVAVARLVSGELVPCTYFERREAVRRLALAGHTHRWIGALLHMPARQVDRDLRRFGLVNDGYQRQRRAARAGRRGTIARLVAAGAQTGEIALLLQVDRKVVARDRKALGISAPQCARKFLRTRGELLSTLGHLLVPSTIHNEWRGSSTTATVQATRKDVA